MPYIQGERRVELDAFLSQFQLHNPGELNYAFTRLLLNYIEEMGRDRGVIKYQDINDILGALEGAKLEFYRRFASDYEDDKIKENGDVYR